MRRWIAIAGGVSQLAAAGATAQAIHPAEAKPGSTAARQDAAIHLRLVQQPGFDQLTLPTTGLAADIEVAPSATIGFHLMSVSRPRLGPEWRTDGRSLRSRKPAVAFTYRF